MLQLSRLFRVYRYHGSLLCLSNDLQLFPSWGEASQWPNFYMCLMKLSLNNRGLLPLQHDLSTENDQARWRLYHWVSYYLLWNAAHRQSVLLCPFQPPPACLVICPFHFHSPGSLWDFFPLDHDSQGYCAVQIFIFARGVHVCKHSHLRACEVVVPKWEFFSGWARGNLISSSPWSHLTYCCYYCRCSDPLCSEKDRFLSPESQEEF